MTHILAVDDLPSMCDMVRTPILMLTTESSVEYKREGKEAGATGWIVKPFDPPLLVATIQRVPR